MFPHFEHERNPFVRVGGMICAYVLTVVACAAIASASVRELAVSLAAEMSAAAVLDDQERAERPAALAFVPAGVALTAPISFAAPPLAGAAVRLAYATEATASVPPRDDDSAYQWSSRAGQTYRTMCVRLCDGYFFPVSFSTLPARFGDDESACRASCGSPARLYVFKNPGETPAAMENLDGEPYAKLESAHLFRSKYDKSCSCRGQPWTQEARERHRIYALRDATARGEASEAEKAELARLESSLHAWRRPPEAADRVAGLGRARHARHARARVGAKSARVRIAAAAPRRRRNLPGRMSLGGGRPRFAMRATGARRRSTSVGEMILRTLSGAF